jgi:glutathione synthase/RimK-type ligase-like ATP-grasp enzyme
MICIHPCLGSFSDRWIENCQQRKVPFVTLDLLETNALQRLGELRAKAVLFHLPYQDPTVALIGKHLTKAIELLGIKVFPNERTSWHFDDKLAQKYLFEALRIAGCPTYCFFSRKAALGWAKETAYPKVWKLKTGAGSDNVRLVHSEAEACHLIRQAFAGGFQPTPPVFGDFRTKVFKHDAQRDWRAVLRRLPQTLWNVSTWRRHVPRERGYVYFQEFLPGNDYDTRVTVIGSRAFAFRRFVRHGDFRASGSGRIDWDPQAIDLQCVETAYEAMKRTGAQCLAFDFVYDLERKPVVLEISYGFLPGAIHQCPGFWDRTLAFHRENVWPQDAILDDLLESI